VSHADEEHESSRRDFLYYATGGAGVVVAGAAIWPLVDQMNPSADVLALSSIRVDISSVEPGTQLTVKWLGKPVFIRRRLPEEIEEARAVEINDLPDPLAENANLPSNADAADINRSLDEAGEFGGWFCPCHGSHYDTAGRIRKGPAPTNLPVPVALFVDETTIQLG
jgi:ubiquinol-cytochrome c reductase iron-sulfur subunit